MSEIEILELISNNQVDILDGVLQFQQQSLDIYHAVSYIVGVIIALIFVLIFALTWGSEKI